MRRKRSRIGKGQGVHDLSIRGASATSMRNHQGIGSIMETLANAC